MYVKYNQLESVAHAASGMSSQVLRILPIAKSHRKAIANTPQSDPFSLGLLDGIIFEQLTPSTVRPVPCKSSEHQAWGTVRSKGGPYMAAIFGPGDHFCGGTVHGVTGPYELVIWWGRGGGGFL